jgi:hypothetical protein
MPVTEVQADKLLRSLKTPTRERRNAVASLFGEPEAVVAAKKLLALAREPADPVIWGALLVYAAGGQDPAPLAKRINDKRPGVRVLSAQGLLARGDARGFPVLIAEIEAGVRDPGAEWANASHYLTRWTAESTLGPPFDADAGQRSAAAERWKAWWAKDKDKLEFKDGRWSAA